jgi:hypothetical protein
LTGVADRRLRGDIDVEDNAEEMEEVTEKTLEGGFEIGVSRSDENSKPGRFPRCSDSEGSEVDVYMLQM